MEDFEKYTATKSQWDFEIEKEKFTCEELTIGEEVDFFNYYIDVDGRQNVAKLRLVQATKLVKTPFTTKWIKHVFDIFFPDMKVMNDITWETLNMGHRLLFLGKLKPEYISEICKKVGEHYDDKEEIIKN